MKRSQLHSLLLVAALLPLPAFTDEAAAKPEKAPSAFEIHGQFSARYGANSLRADMAAVDTNGDVFTNVRDLNDRNLFLNGALQAQLTEKFRFEASGFFRSDLGSGTNLRGYYPQATFYTASSNFGIDGALETAFFTLSRPVVGSAFSIDFLKFGRLYGAQLGAMPMDGASVSFTFAKSLGLGLYGGIRVPLWETLDPWGNDFTVGADLRLKLGSNAKLGLGYQLRRTVQMLSNLAGTNMDHRLGLSWRHRAAPVFGYMASFGLLNFMPFDARLSADSSIEKAGLDLRLSALARFADTNLAVAGSELFTGVMGATKPYFSVDFSASKGFGKYVEIDAGILLRNLFSASNASAYNRNYVHGFLGLVFHPFSEAFSVSLNGDAWSSGSNQLLTGGFDLTYDERLVAGANGRLKISAGTAFSAYSYDTVDWASSTGTNWVEKVNVRTWYAKVRFPVVRGLGIDARYEFEQALTASHLFRAGINYEF